MNIHTVNIFLNPAFLRDKLIGLSSSVFLHVLLLIIGGAVFVRPAEYGVEVGKSGIEIHLVAAPNEAAVEEEQVAAEEQPIAEIAKEEVIAPDLETPKKEVLTQGQDEVNYHSSGGAITATHPEYLKNPAPPYPLKARQNGWEGVVVLKARIDKDGIPISVEINQSCGHRILDEAALATVKKWRFRPAMLGDIPVEASVQLSIRFELTDKR